MDEKGDAMGDGVEDTEGMAPSGPRFIFGACRSSPARFVVFALALGAALFFHVGGVVMRSLNCGGGSVLACVPMPVVQQLWKGPCAANSTWAAEFGALSVRERASASRDAPLPCIPSAIWDVDLVLRAVSAGNPSFAAHFTKPGAFNIIYTSLIAWRTVLMGVLLTMLLVTRSFVDPADAAFRREMATSATLCGLLFALSLLSHAGYDDAVIIFGGLSSYPSFATVEHSTVMIGRLFGLLTILTTADEVRFAVLAVPLFVVAGIFPAVAQAFETPAGGVAFLSASLVLYLVCSACFWYRMLWDASARMPSSPQGRAMDSVIPGSSRWFTWAAVGAVVAVIAPMEIAAVVLFSARMPLSSFMHFSSAMSLLSVFVGTVAHFGIAFLQRSAHERLQIMDAVLARDHSRLHQQRALASFALHEVKRPLAAVVLGLEELQHEVTEARAESGAASDGSDGGLGTLMGEMNAASHAVMSVLVDALAFAKIEAGTFQLRWAPADVRALLEGCTATLAALARERSVRVDVRVEDSVPPTVDLDKDRIAQVVRNLLSNAIKFSPSGSRVDLLAYVAPDLPDAVQGFSIPRRSSLHVVHATPASASASTSSANSTSTSSATCRARCAALGGRLCAAAPAAGSEAPMAGSSSSGNEDDAAPHSPTSALAPGMHLVVQVTDRGPGIAPDIRDRLFHPFIQDKLGRDAGTKGSGLGLAICHSLIVKHRGLNAFASEPGKTIFRVLIPLVAPPTALAPPSPARRSASQSHFSFPSATAAAASIGEVLHRLPPTAVTVSVAPPPAAAAPVATIAPAGPRRPQRSRKQHSSSVEGVAPVRILLADDDSILRHMVARAIHRAHADWQVAEASSGLECLLMLSSAAEQARPFAAVLLDRSMPGISGLETAVRIRDNVDDAVRSVPIVMLSANLESADREETRSVGILRFLDKPVDHATLLDALHLAVAASHAGDAATTLLQTHRDKASSLGLVSHTASLPIS